MINLYNNLALFLFVIVICLYEQKTKVRVTNDNCILFVVCRINCITDRGTIQN